MPKRILANAIQWVLPEKTREKLNQSKWAVAIYRFILGSHLQITKPLPTFSYEDFLVHHEQEINAQSVPEDGPLISIIVPVFRPDLNAFDECIESVKKQSYTRWQLVLVDDASQSERLDKKLTLLQNDERISVIVREKNGHISAASNTGLDYANGEFIALLDQDDLLHPMALASVVNQINNSSDVQMVYTDEDKLSFENKRFDAHFKPVFSPDLLYSNNYISHFGVYNTQRAKSIGGFRIGLEGSQDFDFVLRFTRTLRPEQIKHIPFILYHWRALPGSTALDSDEKSYTVNAGLKALRDYFQMAEDTDSVEALEVPNTYKVNWRLSEVAPSVDIVIPTRNGVDILKPCVTSLQKTIKYENYRIVIIDNQSDCPDTLDYLSSITAKNNVDVVSFNEPFNYARMHNQTLKFLTSDFVLLLNNDIEALEPGWFEEMLSLAKRANTGIVGATLLYPDSTIQHAGVTLGVGGVANHAYLGQPCNTLGYFGRARLRRNVAAVTGACMMFKRKLWNDVGGMEEDKLKVAFNDIDFCLKVHELGLYNVITPFSVLIHHESKSRGKDTSDEQYARFVGEVTFMREKWGTLLDNDPFYSRNLSKKVTDYQLISEEELFQ